MELCRFDASKYRELRQMISALFLSITTEAVPHPKSPHSEQYEMQFSCSCGGGGALLAVSEPTWRIAGMEIVQRAAGVELGHWEPNSAAVRRRHDGVAGARKPEFAMKKLAFLLLVSVAAGALAQSQPSSPAAKPAGAAAPGKAPAAQRPAAAGQSASPASTSGAPSPLAPLPPPSPTGQVIQEIVARVNGDIITRSEYQRSRDQMLQEVRQNNADAAAVADQEKNVLRDLLDRQLLLQKGKDLGITGDTELIKELDRMRKEMKLESMEDLDKAAQAQGISFEDYKQNMREQIVTQQVIGREVGSRIQITPEEIKKFYDDHQKELERVEAVRLSEILISPLSNQAPAGDKTPPPEPSPEQVAAAEQTAKQVLAELKKGTSFEDAAKKYSNGPTAEQGGDIGAFKRGTLAKALEDQTFAMKAGEISDVIRTKQGFVILKVTQHQQPGMPTLAEVERQIQDNLYMQKMNPAMRIYLTKLREEAYIDIKPGYVDSGASPNQTKPVVTTASVSDAKDKLKRKKKFLIF